jgi:DNA-binding winged helix-turn-helix (wHTH) protein
MEGTGRRAIRFGTFEADPATGELRKAGRRINLQDQPFRLLLLLLEHPGEVVTRTELREKLWGETYVDFEEGLNTAVRKLRDALGDSASNPRFIETLPRRGYRFIAPAEIAGGSASPPPPEPVPARRPVRRQALFGLCGTAVIVAGFLLQAWLFREKPVAIGSSPIQLTRDSGLTSEPVISQDGKLLAYTSDRAGDGNLDIWVQYTSGGEPRRLTNDPADERQPEISPDGSTVIFRSERNPPGIYSVPTLGGEPRLIIKDGYVPRFSPDGSRIAYAIGLSGSGGFFGKLHIFTPATGSTRLARTRNPSLELSGH